MGSSLRPKSTRAKSVRPGKRPATRENRPQGQNSVASRGLRDAGGGPGGDRKPATRARHGHYASTLPARAVLERQDDIVGEEMSAGAGAAVRWVYLPDMRAMLLERVHAVHVALDPVSLMKASKAFTP
jgi:hypothetical protein